MTNSDITALKQSGPWNSYSDSGFYDPFTDPCLLVLGK